MSYHYRVYSINKGEIRLHRYGRLTRDELIYLKREASRLAFLELINKWNKEETWLSLKYRRDAIRLVYVADEQ